MRPSTTPSTSNAISSHAPRCGSSDPRQPTNGATRSRQRVCLLRFIPLLLVAVNLTMPGEWYPRMPERLDDEELADWRAGRDAIYQLAAQTAGARRAVAD